VYDTAEHVCELVGGDCVVVVGVEDPEGMVEVLLDGGGVSRNGGVEHHELVEAEFMKSSSSASALAIMRAMVMRSRARRTHSLFSARALLSSHRPRHTPPPFSLPAPMC
jgi:hypothetical protein